MTPSSTSTSLLLPPLVGVGAAHRLAVGCRGGEFCAVTVAMSAWAAVLPALLVLVVTMFMLARRTTKHVQVELTELMALLQTTPGTAAPTLAEETTVVVMSEMGRTPALNANLGKDHWPFTSVMIVGDGFTGDRVVGGFDSGWMGQPLEFTSGDISSSGRLLTAEAVGATLLEHLGVDPFEYVTGTDPLHGVLT